MAARRETNGRTAETHSKEETQGTKERKDVLGKMVLLASRVKKVYPVKEVLGA